jgi:hypothetical protein
MDTLVDIDDITSIIVNNEVKKKSKNLLNKITSSTTIKLNRNLRLRVAV